MGKKIEVRNKVSENCAENCAREVSTLHERSYGLVVLGTRSSRNLSLEISQPSLHWYYRSFEIPSFHHSHSQLSIPFFIKRIKTKPLHFSPNTKQWFFPPTSLSQSGSFSLLWCTIHGISRECTSITNTKDPVIDGISRYGIIPRQFACRIQQVLPRNTWAT